MNVDLFSIFDDKDSILNNDDNNGMKDLSKRHFIPCLDRYVQFKRFPLIFSDFLRDESITSPDSEILEEFFPHDSFTQFNCHF